MKSRWLAVVLGLAIAGVIRLGLAFWRGSDRLDAFMITIVSFALIGVGYFIFRSGK